MKQIGPACLEYDWNITEIFLFSNLSTEIQAIPVLKAIAKTQSIGHQPTTEYPLEFTIKMKY